MRNKGFRNRKSVTKKEMIEELKKKHNAGAVHCSEQETKTIAIEQENERNSQIWRYFMVLSVFQRQGSELEDIKHTVEDMKKAGILLKEINGIYVSVKTMELKLAENYVAHRKLTIDAQRQLKILKEAWGVTDDELEKKYSEWITKPV